VIKEKECGGGDDGNKGERILNANNFIIAYTKMK
jgi:hypothetical protein